MPLGIPFLSRYVPAVRRSVHLWFDEVFQFLVRHSYIFIERLSIVPAAPRMCTIQISLKYNSAVFLFIYPVFRCCPHLGLSLRISSRELIHVYKLECCARRGLCLSD